MLHPLPGFGLTSHSCPGSNCMYLWLIMAMLIFHRLLRRRTDSRATQRLPYQRTIRTIFLKKPSMYILQTCWSNCVFAGLLHAAIISWSSSDQREHIECLFLTTACYVIMSCLLSLPLAEAVPDFAWILESICMIHEPAEKYSGSSSPDPTPLLLEGILTLKQWQLLGKTLSSYANQILEYLEIFIKPRL